MKVKTGSSVVRYVVPIGVLFLCFYFRMVYAKPIVIASPDKNIVVTCEVENAVYYITYHNQKILDRSSLGLVRDDEDFSQHLILIRAMPPEVVKDHYSMVIGKRREISYVATQQVIETKTASGKRMNIIFRVSNDGVAFQYEFPEQSKEIRHITRETTTFHFFENTRAWLQPKTEAQTGFEHTNPSYEAHYMMDIPTGTPSPSTNGWIYPALFKYENTWMLITEAGLGRTYCGTALQQDSKNSEYKINFPQAPEVFTNGALNPESALPWKTPWRIIALGDLKTIGESTLGTDLAAPADKNINTSFIKPGKASWSWILKKDDSTIFKVQKKYIDFAADMKWQYCLIDANWDSTIGYDSAGILADYGKKKNVGLLLWYNSAGNWNTVKYHPKDKLLTHQDRVKEFTRLQSMGIRGIKVDFFAGDGQSMMNYYRDILEDAANYNLLVNFHGATLPRGLQRTYPNLMTTEAVHGYEMITFDQHNADLEPSHAVMCGMVRNVFDPMDFTPMCLYKIPGIKRVTTATFELATSVVFLSGIQHYAESPDGMSHVSKEVKDFLRNLPDSWDDVKFIDGYPGKLMIVARKKGDVWYVAGINGENAAKTLSLDLPFLKNKKGQLISSGPASETNEPSFRIENIVVSNLGKLDVTLEKNDGFVITFR